MGLYYQELLRDFSMKLSKEKLCTIVQISYHLLFLGSTATVGNYYLEEFEKTRNTIVTQVDRIDDIGKKVNKNLNKVKKVCKF